MIKRLTTSWKIYKYRFLPWLTFNFGKRSVRLSERDITDKIISEDILKQQISKLLEILSFVPNLQKINGHKTHLKAIEAVRDTFGYVVVVSNSQMGGRGVVVCEGEVPKGGLVGLYPGGLYLPSHPAFFASLSNPFILRCLDGILVDGKSKGLSNIIFKSCLGRDRSGIHDIADSSWMSSMPCNPFNIGQYVNNQNKEFKSNVAYQELSLEGKEISIHCRCLLPNLWVHPPTGNTAEAPLRIVALIATRDIQRGEELFSDYFTIVV